VQASSAELAKVVIHVKIRKAHPCTVGHWSEMRMRLPLKVAWLARESIHQAQKLTDVVVKLRRGGAAGLLSSSGAVLNPFGQGKGTQRAIHLSRLRG